MSEKGGILKKWNKQYLLEYLVALILIVGTNALCIPAARAAAARKMLLMTPPVIAILIMGLVILRHYRRVDEFLRRELVQSMAVTAAFTYAWATCYGVCEIAGFPRLSIWWVWGSITVVMNLWLFGKGVLLR
ncbi:MAG TPA: hypothetical protein VMG30_18980 [Acidobacteriota bacterium]|nr:hypothetical protein [Acidobacteriota bacterium]